MVISAVLIEKPPDVSLSSARSWLNGGVLGESMLEVELRGLLLRVVQGKCKLDC